jgi:hypothetical protein
VSPPASPARRAFLALCAAYAAAVVAGYALAPDRVPLHFGLDGAADRTGTPEEWVLTAGLVGLGVALALGGLAAWVDRIPFDLVNVPHKDYWARPENTAEVRAMLRADAYRLGAATMALLCVVVVTTVLAARSESPSLGLPFMVLLGVWLVSVLGWAFVGLPRRYAVPGARRG